MKKLLKKLKYNKKREKIKEIIIPIIILLMMIIIIIISIYKIITKDLDGVNFNDKTSPQCIISELNKKENPKNWTNNNQTISISCLDSNGSGCKKEVYTKTFTTSTETGIITIEDKSGNKTNCEVSVNIDKDNPTCNIVVDGIKGDNGWYKEKNVKVYLTMNDETTEVVEYGLTNIPTPTYNFQKEAVQTDTATTTWYGYVKDSVGNISTCQKTIKLDTQKPICNISTTGLKGNNNWYISPVTISITKYDNGPSNIASFGLSLDENIKLDNIETKIQNKDVINQVWNGKVKDIAGNENICLSEIINIDVTKPKITFNNSPGEYKNNEPLLITSMCLDETSGVTTSQSETILLSPSINNEITHTCTDNAGNTSTITGIFHVKKYSRDITCGVEKYNICTHPVCGEKKDLNGNTIYEQCRNEKCGIASYKECWHY